MDDFSCMRFNGNLESICKPLACEQRRRTGSKDVIGMSATRPENQPAHAVSRHSARRRRAHEA